MKTRGQDGRRRVRAGVAIRVSARTLDIGQPARGEIGPQDRQVPQRRGDPDVLQACNSDGLW